MSSPNAVNSLLANTIIKIRVISTTKYSAVITTVKKISICLKSGKFKTTITVNISNKNNQNLDTGKTITKTSNEVLDLYLFSLGVWLTIIDINTTNDIKSEKFKIRNKDQLRISPTPVKKSGKNDINNLNDKIDRYIEAKIIIALVSFFNLMVCSIVSFFIYLN
ncbi:hypothetical protein MBOVa_0900 [Mycoplasmopsis bovis 8790]|nr:hypothetical protein MBOVa_0900 [Mycoplasmopsis bovis 8790]